MRIGLSHSVHENVAVPVDGRTETRVVHGAGARHAVEQTAAHGANAVEERLLADHLAPVKPVAHLQGVRRRSVRHAIPRRPRFAGGHKNRIPQGQQESIPNVFVSSLAGEFLHRGVRISHQDLSEGVERGLAARLQRPHLHAHRPTWIERANQSCHLLATRHDASRSRLDHQARTFGDFLFAAQCADFVGKCALARFDRLRQLFDLPLRDEVNFRLGLYLLPHCRAKKLEPRRVDFVQRASEDFFHA